MNPNPFKATAVLIISKIYKCNCKCNNYSTHSNQEFSAHFLHLCSQYPGIEIVNSTTDYRSNKLAIFLHLDHHSPAMHWILT